LRREPFWMRGLSGNPYSLPKFASSTAFWGRFPKVQTSTEEINIAESTRIVHGPWPNP